MCLLYILLPVYSKYCCLSTLCKVSFLKSCSYSLAEEMLKAIQVSAPIEQQTATAEMESASANGPVGAAIEYSIQPPTNAPATTLQQQVQEHQEEPTEPEMEEYKLFRDYFGLINLVKSFANVPDELISPTSEYSFEQELRERRDSLGSAGSEFSSSNSAESTEVADIYYTAYGRENLMKQAFMDPIREDSMMKMANPNPSSMLLEHKIITSIVAKKPQVCSYDKPHYS